MRNPILSSLSLIPLAWALVGCPKEAVPPNADSPESAGEAVTIAEDELPTEIPPEAETAVETPAVAVTTSLPAATPAPTPMETPPAPKIAATPQPSATPSPSPKPTPSAAIAPAPAGISAATKLLYGKHCKKCHGWDGTGNTATGRKRKIRSWTTAEFQAEAQDDKMLDAILNGWEDPKDSKRSMPALKEKITEAQAKALVGVVRAFGKKAPFPDEVD